MVIGGRGRGSMECGSCPTGTEAQDVVVGLGSEHVSASGVVNQEWWRPLLAALEFQRGSLKQEEAWECSSDLDFSPESLAHPQLAKSYPLEGELPFCVCALAPGGEWFWEELGPRGETWFWEELGLGGQCGGLSREQGRS